MFELYLMDLDPEKRKEFLEAHGCWDADVEDPSTFPNNWDVFPIMTFDPDDYDYDDSDVWLYIVYGGNKNETT